MAGPHGRRAVPRLDLPMPLPPCRIDAGYLVPAPYTRRPRKLLSGSSGFCVGRPYLLWSGSPFRAPEFPGVDALVGCQPRRAAALVIASPCSCPRVNTGRGRRRPPLTADLLPAPEHAEPRIATGWGHPHKTRRTLLSSRALRWLRGLDMLNATRSPLAIGLILFFTSLPASSGVADAYPQPDPGSASRGFVTPAELARLNVIKILGMVQSTA